MTRASGILLHITSLPNKYGLGCFSKEAYDFVDFLSATCQKYWQVLPINPTNDSLSPFQSPAVFAGSIKLIDVTQYLTQKELESLNIKPTKSKNSKTIHNQKIKALKYIFDRDFNKTDMSSFVKQNDFWLKDYAMFMALKDEYKGVDFRLFPKGLNTHEKQALEKFCSTHKKQIDFYTFVQFLFFTQWEKLKNYANNKGIKIIGDLSFYPANDSCDMWANSKEFCLDDSGNPTGIAGVPPDYFSKDGQLWGNAVYNIKNMQDNNFSWWVKRLKSSLKLFDLVRLDHFRGYESFWCCLPQSKTAKEGKWVKSFGVKLFDNLNQKSTPHFIAEDLGVITPEVEKLKQKLNFPGMKVFQFAFDGDEKNKYFPHNYENNCVAYLGTHDNNTFVGFLKEVPPNTLNQIKEYLGLDIHATYEEITNMALTVVSNSNADTTIFTMQDLMLLDESYRMNTPGTIKNNWLFTLPKNYKTNELIKKIKTLTIIAKRN